MKSLKWCSIFITTLLVLFTACKKDEPSQNFEFAISKQAEIDPYIEEQMRKIGIIGLQAAIVKNDQVLWSKGYGFANKAQNRLETAQTIHMIASITKTITAVSTMQLVEGGNINLDGNINDYLPFKVENPNVPNDIITPRHLMTHTSSILDDYFYEALEPNLEILYGRETDVALSLKDFCAGFLLKNGRFYNAKTFGKKKPGVESSYSNIGVSLLGLIVEHVSGKPFYQYAKDHIFQPLGMTRTSFRLADFQVNERSEMYQSDGTPWGNYTISLYPAGGLRSNVEDMSKFLSAIMLDGTLNGKKILNPASVQKMLQAQGTGEGFGLIWYELPIKDDFKVWGHNGGAEGTNTVMFYNKKTKVGALVFTNTDFKKEKDFEVLPEIMANLIYVGEQK